VDRSGCACRRKWLTSRTLNANDETGNHTWNYTYGNNNTTTLEDPLANYTVYTNSFESWCTSYTTSVQYYQGAVSANNLLKTVSTTYSSTPSPFGPEVGSPYYMNIVPTQITTTWANGKTSQITKSYDSGFRFLDPRGNGVQYTGLYGKVTVQKDYDYGTTSGQPGPLLRQTNTSYAWQSPNPNYSTYLSNNMLNLVYSTQITDGTNQKAYTQYGYDETTPIAYSQTPQNLDLSVWTGTLRGNQTSVNRWLNLPTVQTVTSKTTFYDTGMPSVATDPLLNPTTYSYSSTFQDAYVTQVQNALTPPQSVYYNYDYDTGLKTSTTDLNGQVTTDSYDSSWRLLNVTRPTNGGQTSFCYTDLNASNCAQGSAPFQVVITKGITSAGLNETATAAVDGLGRLVQTQLNSDPDGVTYTQTTYDALGRKSSAYNPTRCYPPTTNCGTETTWGYSTNNYEALGRVTFVVEQDGSTVSTDYASFPCTTVTDEAGRSRTSCEDGLGRVTGVWEDPSGLNYETDYQYDTLGNLLTVTQKGSNSSNKRTRTFTYDSLSRLLSASNPESGTIAYSYDADGNVLTKTAPSPNQPATGTKTVTTTYGYEQLNRLKSKTYADSYSSNPTTAGVSYGYDGVALTGCTISPPADADSYPVGHRTAMCDGSGAASWKHDQMGRTLEERRTIGSVVGDYNTDTYNLDGSVSSITTLGYGVSYTYGGAARPLTATTSSANLAQGGTYAPPGDLAGLTIGSATGFAGIVASNAYNPRLQPILLSAGVTGHNPVFSLCYDFHLHVAVTGPAPCSFSASSAGDNGNAYTIVNNRDNTRTQNFIYDSLNRIQQGYSSGTQWGETFGPTATNPGVAPSTPGIDAWANLTNRSGVTGKTYYEPLSVTAGTNNQLSGFNYDAAGNMILNGSASYFYDAENRLIATAGYSYVYDGDGQRVEKCTQGTTPGTCASNATGTLYWKGMGSAPLTETDLAGNLQNTYIFFQGQRIARSDSSGAIHYYFSDQLGSHGVVENATASACEQDIDYYPYGGVESDYCSNVAQHYKFTGKERDTESGLDNFGARYNASSLGRFMTPDPIAGVLANPQSLNRYAYVLNRPLVLTDPTGMIVDWNDSKKSKKDGKTDAQRAFEERLEQLQNSKNAKDRANGATLQKTYDRLQASKATFEVVKPDSTGESRGDLRYDGNGHFTVNLKGDMTNAAGFTDNQKLAHEFEHGRQVLDGELSYKFNPESGSWDPFAHDVIDEANGFAAGFAIEGATPGQGSIINGAATALTNGGIPGEASYLHSHFAGYRGLREVQLNVPSPPPPGVYEVPK
jgi:RHS repeat-associated protein